MGVSALASSSGGPSKTIRPPSGPAPGPSSMSQSQVARSAGSCSTTSTVLPASTTRVEGAGEHGDVGDLADRRWARRARTGRLPCAGRASSLASLSRCASPPERLQPGLADDEVAEAERDRGVAHPTHGVDVAPLVDELGDGEGLDVGERSVPLDEGGDLAAIAGAAAGVAGLGHRRQERHVLLPRALALARVAAIGEVLDRDALLDGHLARGEHLADGVDEPEEHPRRGDLGPGLVGDDRSGGRAGDGVVNAGLDADHAAAGDVGLRSRQPQRDGVDDERRLPRPGHAADADLHAERDADVEAAQVVLPRTRDLHPALSARDGGRGAAMRHCAVEHGPGDRLVAVEIDEAAARSSGTGADLDDVVGGADERRVVLDGDDGVAGVAQLGQRAGQRGHLRGMQAAGRLVEQHGHADQSAAEHRRQLDPLRLAGRQRPGRPVQVEVAEPDGAEEAEAATARRCGRRPRARRPARPSTSRTSSSSASGRREQVVAVATVEADRQVRRHAAAVPPHARHGERRGRPRRPDVVRGPSAFSPTPRERPGRRTGTRGCASSLSSDHGVVRRGRTRSARRTHAASRAAVPRRRSSRPEAGSPPKQPPQTGASGRTITLVEVELAASTPSPRHCGQIAAGDPMR